MSDALFGVGKSILGDSLGAAKEAAQNALSKLKGKEPTFALMFATTGYDQNLLMQGFVQVFGNLPMSGCSGEGIITPSGSEEGSCVVAIMLFSGSEFKVCNFLTTGLKDNSYKCGEEIAESFNQCPISAKGSLMIFLDSMTANVTKVFEALEKKLTWKPLILGGTAGDMMKFQKTYQYHNGKVYTDAISAVLLPGDYQIDWLVSHGCEEIGFEQTVTKSDKNAIVEIDNQPAWEVFRKYLPGNPDIFKAEDAFHLCLGEVHKCDEPYGEQLIIRMPVGLEKKTGAVKFSVEIPIGCPIHLTRRDPQSIAENVLNAFKGLLERNKDKKVLAVFQYDCAGRGKVIYGDMINTVLFKPLQQLLDPDTPWIGFHTYGEIAPIGSKIFFHNFTAVIAVLFDK
ncbi:MAG: FIST C-terminal domain-containing protein [Gammaproteobacteria bacterium]|nr:FIST C-terminal domain-containing protein [Gammaproteobacteria bacterium]